ncbi:MAG: UbiD family decarboxylase [Pseudomonadota bacterium]
MSSPDLRFFVQQADSLGWLDRVREPLSTNYQAARRIFDAGSRAVLLENLEGHRTPVLANIAATRPLLARALDCSVEGLVRHVADAISTPGELRVVTDAPFLANQHATPQLDSLVPLMRFYPRSERVYASACVICARHPAFGMNLSYHRMMYLGGNRFAVRIVPRHLHQILELGGGQAEVAVVVGLHPAVGLAAAISFGPDFDEMACAASLLGQPLDVFDLDGLQVPAGAEMVWKARFTGELADEGPFVDLTGTYDGIRQQPVLEVQRLYHRDDYIYQVILPGGSEHRILMGVPQEPRIFRIVQNTVAGLRDVVLSEGGCGWLHAVVSIDQRAAGQGKNAGLAALAAHPSLKRVVVVDGDVDIHDPVAVEWAIATRVQPDRDLVIVGGAHGSSLDPSRDPRTETTSKWVIDATRPAGFDPQDFSVVEPPR